jgi:hypothetical protein
VAGDARLSRRLDLELGQRCRGGQPRGVGLEGAAIADVVGAEAAQACFDRSRQWRVRAEMGDDEQAVVTLPIVVLDRGRVAETRPQPLEEIVPRFLIPGTPGAARARSDRPSPRSRAAQR